MKQQRRPQHLENRAMMRGAVEPRSSTVVSMENAGIEGVSGPGGRLKKNHWVKAGRFGQGGMGGKRYKPVPPPRYEMDAFLSLKEQGFTAGLCKAVLEQNSTHFAKRFWIVDNSASMDQKDGHRIVTTSERKTLAQQVTRWEELTATVIFHSQMVAVLGSPSHFRMLNATPPKEERKHPLRGSPNRVRMLNETPMQELNRDSRGKSQLKSSIKLSPVHDGEEKKEAKSEKLAKRKDDKEKGVCVSQSQHAAEEAKLSQIKDAELKAKFRRLLDKPLATDRDETQRSGGVSQQTAPPKSKDLIITSSFSVLAKGTNESAEEQVRKARLTMQRAKPHGPTPLTKHITIVTKEIMSMLPELRKSKKRVTVVIATDGLPTTEDGTAGETATRQFVAALRAMENLPVWLVIRLCTDDKKLLKFYNKLDQEVNLPLEVLDDYFGESAEIRKHNPWLNYTLPMHRCRELGYHHRILDLLDERPLKIEELREFAAILFGDDLEDIPLPELQWREFEEYLKEKVNSEEEQYDTQRKRCVPVLDLGIFKRTYHGLRKHLQPRKVQRKTKSKGDEDTVAC